MAGVFQPHYVNSKVIVCETTGGERCVIMQPAKKDNGAARRRHPQRLFAKYHNAIGVGRLRSKPFRSCYRFLARRVQSPHTALLLNHITLKCITLLGVRENARKRWNSESGPRAPSPQRWTRIIYFTHRSTRYGQTNLALIICGVCWVQIKRLSCPTIFCLSTLVDFFSRRIIFLLKPCFFS